MHGHPSEKQGKEAGERKWATGLIRENAYGFNGKDGRVQDKKTQVRVAKRLHEKKTRVAKRLHEKKTQVPYYHRHKYSSIIEHSR
jgi:hypothetical protein